MSGVNGTSLVPTGNSIQRLDSKSSNPESSFSAATEGNQEAYENRTEETRLARNTPAIRKNLPELVVLMSENGQAAKKYKSYFVDGKIVEAAELAVV